MSLEWTTQGLVGFFAVDPKDDEYPWNSPYAFSDNKVIDSVELEGAEYKNFRIFKVYKNSDNVWTSNKNLIILNKVKTTLKAIFKLIKLQKK